MITHNEEEPQRNQYHIQIAFFPFHFFLLCFPVVSLPWSINTVTYTYIYIREMKEKRELNGWEWTFWPFILFFSNMLKPNYTLYTQQNFPWRIIKWNVCVLIKTKQKTNKKGDAFYIQFNQKQRREQSKWVFLNVQKLKWTKINKVIGTNKRYSSV